MAVDISPLMNHPAWGRTMTAAQRKQALDLWQDPATSDSDRTQMLQIMQGWQDQAAQEPSTGQRLISSVGGMLKQVPGLVYDVTVAPFLRAGHAQGLLAPYAAAQADTPQAREAALVPLEQQTERYTQGVTGLLAGPAFGKAGYAAGEALIPTLAPRIGQTLANAAPAVGEAAGAYGARRAQVEMGNEPPGMVGDIASVALPLGVRAATSAPVARRLPGSAIAQHEMMAEDIQQIPARMQPATASDTLYRALGQHQNPAIDVQDVRQLARDLIAQHTARGAATRDPRVLALAQELDQLGTHYGNRVPLNVLYDRMQAVGELVAEAESKGGRSARELSRIYAGFHGALENAVQQQVPGAETLQQAIQANRQEHAVARLQKIIGQSAGEGRGIDVQEGTGYTFVRGKKMLHDFERLVADDEVFRNSFTKEELADMRTLFKSSVELPRLPVPGSVPKGSMQALLRGSIGAPLGYAIGGPEGATVGASAGILAPEVIARALAHPRGRQYLRAALEGRGGITPQTLAVLNEVLREGGETSSSKRPATTP